MPKAGLPFGWFGTETELFTKSVSQTFYVNLQQQRNDLFVATVTKDGVNPSLGPRVIT